jgi:hypothetical protein
MKCARCSAEIPAQSQFCLRCGTPIQRSGPPTGVGPAAAAYPAARQNNKPLIATAAILLLAILGIAGYMLRNRLVQAPGNSSTGALVQAPGDLRAGAPVQAPADSNPNKVVQAPVPTAPAVNTAEINDYLQFLKGIEQRKQQMAHDLDARLSSMALKTVTGTLQEGLRGTEDPNPGGDPNVKNITPAGTADIAKQIDEEFNRLTYDFQQKLPPPSCVELRNRYYTHLGNLAASLTKMAGIFAEIQTSPNDAYAKVKQMQGQSGNIDDSADSAERALAAVCKKYQLEKDFEIKGDKSPSEALGLPELISR